MSKTRDDNAQVRALAAWWRANRPKYDPNELLRWFVPYECAGGQRVPVGPSEYITARDACDRNVAGARTTIRWFPDRDPPPVLPTPTAETWSVWEEVNP